MTVTLQHSPDGNLCLGYQLASATKATSILRQRCVAPGAGTLIAVQGVEASPDGKMYTIIVGEALSSQITAVSFEFADGGNTPADVQPDGSFMVSLPGQRKAIHAIPVDQYGNLVGPIFAFGS